MRTPATKDQRADIYSAGCIVYQMLSGKLPFDADSSVAIMYMHINNSPQPLRDLLPADAPVEALSNFVNNCMAKDPSKRYQTAAHAIADIESILSGELAAVRTAEPQRKASAQKIANLRNAKPIAIALTALLIPTVALLLNRRHDESVALERSLHADRILRIENRYRLSYKMVPPDVYDEVFALFNNTAVFETLSPEDQLRVMTMLLGKTPKKVWTEADADRLVPVAQRYLRQTSPHNKKLGLERSIADGALALSEFHHIPPGTLTAAELKNWKDRIRPFVETNFWVSDSPRAKYWWKFVGLK